MYNRSFIRVQELNRIKGLPEGDPTLCMDAVNDNGDIYDITLSWINGKSIVATKTSDYILNALIFADILTVIADKSIDEVIQILLDKGFTDDTETC